MTAFRMHIALALIGLGVTFAAALPGEPATAKDDLGERAQAALKRAEANDGAAIPVLIDLLAELPPKKRQPVEEFLLNLAGKWTPIREVSSEDRIARKVRRDAWRAWWDNTNGEALLAVIREHSPTPELRQKVRGLIVKLGDEEFTVRERAQVDLVALGRLTLPQVREAVKSKDLEVARRARQIVESIEKEPRRMLPGAAVRLLALRKPAGAVETLLAYLPIAEEDELTDEVKKSLTVLAMREGKLERALVHALGDPQANVRFTAAAALANGGGDKGRAAVRKLLLDHSATVRLRIALTLGRAGDKSSVPVLIDLLDVLPEEEVGQAEEALHQLAGDAAPETPLGNEPAQRKKCRDAWAAWWKINAPRAEMARLTGQSSLGYYLLCDTGKNCIYEIDRQGKERWRIDNVATPVDAIVLPNNRVLIAEYGSTRVAERDFKGNVLWQKQVGEPVSVQRLPNGNTFIATRPGTLMEVDRTGKEIYSISNLQQQITAAYRLPRGNVVCLTATQGECLLLNTAGTRLKSFATHTTFGDVAGCDLSPAGRIIVTSQPGQKVIEYDSTGRKILEVPAPQAATATYLPNGHYLVSVYQGAGRVYELDRAGKIVWEHKNAGHIYRARRR